MATRKQKEELVEVLKFTPGTYTIQCCGYGGEMVLGTVKRSAYEYFVKNQVNLAEYSWGWADDDCEVPEDLRPFDPGHWYDCDDICHENGVEMTAYSKIVVEDSEGNKIWDHDLEPVMLEESEVAVEEQAEYYAVNVPDHIVFLGQSIEKGVFFNAELELTAPFDPTKLKLIYTDVEGLLLLSEIKYNNEEIYNDGGDTRGKSSEFKFLNTDHVTF